MKQLLREWEPWCLSSCEHSWSTCPGVDEKGEVKVERLREWITTARAVLAERGRAKIGDLHIGQALASAPPDQDGKWPCEPVRATLEELNNDEVERGLEIQIFNNRGVTSRSLDEGGIQERELAAKYRTNAEEFLERWPRTAAIFGRLARSYEADARREDADAELHRRGLDR